MVGAARLSLRRWNAPILDTDVACCPHSEQDHDRQLLRKSYEGLRDRTRDESKRVRSFFVRKVNGEKGSGTNSAKHP